MVLGFRCRMPSPVPVRPFCGGAFHPWSAGCERRHCRASLLSRKRHPVPWSHQAAASGLVSPVWEARSSGSSGTCRLVPPFSSRTAAAPTPFTP